MEFGILPLQVAVWYPAMQTDNSRRVHAVWYPVIASDCIALVCSLRNCHCSGAKLSGLRPVALLAGLQRGGRNFRPLASRLVVWTMQYFNGRQVVMSALEALVLAGKGLNAFSVLLQPRLYSKVWPMLSIFDSNKQKTAVGN
jgi:hypothetical protein